MPSLRRFLLSTSLLLTATDVFAYRSFLPPPQCVVSPGGVFFCTQQQDMVKLARERVGDGNLRFVQLAYESPASSVGPIDHQGLATVRFSLYQGFDPATKLRDAEAVKRTSIDWTFAFCAAIDGKMVRYPVNGISEGIAPVERWACHSSDENMPQFGVEASSVAQPGQPRYVEVLHYSDGQAIRNLWGTGRKFRVGERTNLGMVIEVKPPLVKIQTESSGSPTEKWVREADLSPPPQPVIQ